jgi:hypothetical protein
VGDVAGVWRGVGLSPEQPVTTRLNSSKPMIAIRPLGDALRRPPPSRVVSVDNTSPSTWSRRSVIAGLDSRENLSGFEGMGTRSVVSTRDPSRFLPRLVVFDGSCGLVVAADRLVMPAPIDLQVSEERASEPTQATRRSQHTVHYRAPGSLRRHLQTICLGPDKRVLWGRARHPLPTCTIHRSWDRARRWSSPPRNTPHH